MCHVGIGHDKAVASHDGTSLRGCSPINGYTLADSRVVAYLCRGDFPPKLQVLRDSSNHGAGKDAAAIADACPVEDNGMREDVAVVADDDILLYHCERVDSNVLSELSLGMNNS